MSEARVAQRWPEVLQLARAKGVHRLTVVSDDTIVTQAAVNAVLSAPGRVTTGWCQLADNDPRANLSTAPVHPFPHEGAYAFPTRDEVNAGPEYQRTYFTGMAFTTMTVEDWEQFPFGCYGADYEPGHASDLHLSYRLQRAGVEITAARDGFITHLKAVWNERDYTPGRELLIGPDREAIVWSEP